MALTCGIVGLPNVGKSTLFNALSGVATAEAANYPFCTIEPNQAIVPVPDDRLLKLAELAESAKTIPTSIEFVDIAGLVAGASKGEGLGNKFLSHIRQVDAIIHVARCFEDENITHVAETIDPVRDIGIVETELILKDYESVEKRIDRTSRAAKSGDKKEAEALKVYESLLAHLDSGSPARSFEVSDRPRYMSDLFLLTDKPVLYAANVGESDLPDGNAHVQKVRDLAEAESAQVVVVCAELEAQLLALEEEERTMFMEESGLEQTGLQRLIHRGYELLGLITYFTAGPKEARAWTIENGTKAPQAAGVIHTDFEKGFIRAETIAYEDYLSSGSEAAARSAGVMRSEGKEYVVKDGDVMLFRFNV